VYYQFSPPHRVSTGDFAYGDLTMFRIFTIALLCSWACPGYSNTELEEIVVTAGFRDTEVMKSAGSYSVIDDKTLHDRAARHLDETLNTLPNVNSTAGGARARFIQIRGVGDLEQFVDPKHFPSVGITVDGVEIGTTATGAVLMDVEQIEVLRGPQGTEFGANALAGLVNILTYDPAEEFEATVNSAYGNYGSWRIGTTLSGPLSDSLGGRIAVQKQESDGFYENAFLNSDRTNKRDELNINAKLRWQGENESTVSLIGRYSDIDSGYDAFSLDNTRTTISDNPGRDAQESYALAVKSSWSIFNDVTFETTLSWHQEDEAYSFDEDWVFSGFCDGVICDPLFEFSSTDSLFRKRDTYAIDARLKSDSGSMNWIAGIYAQHRQEDLNRLHFIAFDSMYETDRYAVYGQLDLTLNERLLITAGLRYEYFEDEYADTNMLITASDDNYWSGRLSAEYQLDEATLIYATLSRSVKPGGVNTETSSNFSVINPFFQAYLSSRQQFDAETLFNKEIGIKGRYHDNRLALRLTLFHMDRSNAQLESFVWDASTFIFTGFLDSTSDAENYGAELELNYQLADDVDMFANIGYLKTGVDSLNVFDLDLNQFVQRDNRDQAKSPEWQYNIGLNYDFNESLFGRIELEGQGDSFYGYYHNSKIDDYSIVNASLSYQYARLGIQVWVRNILDKDYQTHGLYFANDPRDLFSINRSYYQFGEPRVYGVNLSYTF
jgi:iron complex outermembrane receptor protein